MEQGKKNLPGTESGSDMKGSQKGFFWYISYKSKTRKNEGQEEVRV